MSPAIAGAGYAAWHAAVEAAAAAVAGPGREWAANRVVLRTVGSTNALARRVVEEYLEEGVAPPRAVLLAHEQTAGRGRHGRAWASRAGAGVYATLVCPLTGRAELAPLPLLVPVALAAVLDRHLPPERPCGIKWPNDLVVGGRKIGGVLIDGVAPRGEDGGEGAALVGFGINLAQSADELAAIAGSLRATSVAAESAAVADPARLAWELVAAVAGAVAGAAEPAGAAAAYAARSVHRLGERLRCRTGEETVEGRFRGFDASGSLRLELAHATGGRSAGDELLVHAGEVVPT